MVSPVHSGCITKSHTNIPIQFVAQIQNPRWPPSTIFDFGDVLYSHSEVCAAQYIVDGSLPNHTQTLLRTCRGFLIHFLAQIQNPRWPPSTIFDFAVVLSSKVCAAQYIVGGSSQNHTQTFLFILWLKFKIQDGRHQISSILVMYCIVRYVWPST